MSDLSIIKELERFIGKRIPHDGARHHEKIGYSVTDTKRVNRLSLSSCKINDLKPLIPLLKKLRYLRMLKLSNNGIEDLSPLAQLKNLTWINLYTNKISDLRPLGNLENLRWLALGENKITDITHLESLTGLRELMLDSNQISDITSVKKLSNLQLLILNNNIITNIDAVQNLKNLRTLGLKNNPIKELPSWIIDFNMDFLWDKDGGMTRIGSINLYGPLKKPSAEVIQEGRDAVIRFFQKIKQEGLDYIYETKLILVGEGSAGKTSLQARLMNPRAALPKKDSRTRGIKINDWKFKKEKNQIAISHIWDFGGQDVYYPVHRFFLTENSVFVLLASTRQTHHNFDYWIPTIFQFGGKSPIILGQTCYDGNRTTWTDLGYFVGNSDFNVIKTNELAYLELDLPNSNDGLETIKQVIVQQITSLPHYGKGVPKSYVTLRERLSEMAKKNPCIFYEDFIKMCESADREGFANAVDVEDCARFFHAIGTILWYHNNEVLKDWVILQPEWAMNAVYKIIDDDEIQKRRGLIKASDFKRLWSDVGYKNRHATLKNMLQVFKIAFEKKHPKGDYIIPARLLSMPHEQRWDNSEPYLRLEYQYDFMPRGLVNQISAELSRYIPYSNSGKEAVWNNAVDFEYEKAQCQVVEDFYNRKISLLAKGKDARGLVMLVMDALKNTTEEYKGVEPRVNIPCTCEICNTSPTPTLFPYDKLIHWSVLKDTVMCNESGQSLGIDHLLFNVGLVNPVKQQMKRMEETTRTIKIFLASSSELKNDRKEFEIFINRENIVLNKKGIFLELVIWENFVDAISKTRLQDEYNKTIRECDIFVSLFFTKVGKYTSEEFETAFGQFKMTGKPLVYTYFKSASVNVDKIGAEIKTKLAFEKKLKELGHFKTSYKNQQDLQLKFKNQLEMILPKNAG